MIFQPQKSKERKTFVNRPTFSVPRSAFAPWPVSPSALLWYPRQMMDWFRYPGGMGKWFTPIVLAVYLAGLFLLQKRERRTFWLMVSPLSTQAMTPSDRRWSRIRPRA